MTGMRAAISLILLAVSAPYIYDRYLALSALFANRPGNFQQIINVKSHETRFSDVIRNCEDVVLEEALGIAFLSCDPGRDRWNTVMGTFQPPVQARDARDHAHIWLYDYSTPDLPVTKALRPLILSKPEISADFHPLGIEFDPETSTLYVINHSRDSGSKIEVFQVSIQESTAKHVRTFKHPLLHAPNAIQILGDGKMFISNDHYLRAAVSPLLSKVETFAAIPAGSVVYTDIHAPDLTKVVARVPFANGIAMLNSTTLAVASSSKAGIYMYAINADNSLTFLRFLRTPPGVDNLSVDSRGVLLMAGHPFVPQLTQVAKARGNCDSAGTLEEKRACGCDAPSWVGEWSEQGGLKTLLQVRPESGFCASSTAVRDVKRGIGMVSMLYGKGIGVFRE